MITGYGTVASAFGVGAAWANGRFDHAYPLGAEEVVASWPLSNETLLAPRILSDLSDAPCVGESALLFSLAWRPVVETDAGESSRLPPIVYFAILFCFGVGALCLTPAVGSVIHRRKRTLQ